MVIRTVIAAVVLSASLVGQDLTERNYKKLRDHILPKRSELTWEKIKWRPTFWDAVIEAQKKKKPVLLYAMNGHMLSCV